MPIIDTLLRDPVTDTFSNRLGLDREKYFFLDFWNSAHRIPEINDSGTLPAFSEWVWQTLS